MKEIKKQFRHGDLLIEKVSGIEDGCAKLDGNILAYGEVTGHKHALVGKGIQIYQGAEEGQKYISIQETTQLVHEEHGTIELEPGEYVMQRQIEYSPTQNRLVSD